MRMIKSLGEQRGEGPVGENEKAASAADAPGARLPLRDGKGEKGRKLWGHYATARNDQGKTAEGQQANEGVLRFST